MVRGSRLSYLLVIQCSRHVSNCLLDSRQYLVASRQWYAGAGPDKNKHDSKSANATACCSARPDENPAILLHPSTAYCLLDTADSRGGILTVRLDRKIPRQYAGALRYFVA